MEDWLEDRSERMAFYQLQTNILVVGYKKFKYYYKKLMGSECDSTLLHDANKREQIIKCAKERF